MRLAFCAVVGAVIAMSAFPPPAQASVAEAIGRVGVLIVMTLYGAAWEISSALRSRP